MAWGGAAALLAACGGEGEGRNEEGGPGIGSLSQGTATGSGSATDGQTNAGPGSNSMTGTSNAVTGDETASEGMMPDPVFDVVAPEQDVTIPEEGCTKVDFLFTIDNSGSMAGDQANLIANFPAFITGIQSVLETVDEYQVGIVTTDTYNYNVAGCTALSGLVVQTGGSNSSNQTCGPYAAGANFMTEADDLAMEFSCAAQVGTSGSATELTMQATVEAVQKVVGGPGQCNDGFLRDDSLLVIVIITDEAGDSAGNAGTWFNDIVTERSGIEENVAVVSLINTPGGVCGGQIANEISAFTNMFTNGFEADVCIPDYGPVFTQAIGIIEEACNNFVPPG